MRSNKVLFDKSVYNSNYNSENSFGDTYGQHREALELSIDQFKQIKERCMITGVDFIVTPFDELSLENCLEIGVDAIKIASFDLGNIPFLERIAQTSLPIVMSTGGGNLDQIKASIQCITRVHSDIALLHCVSKYPCPASEVNLNTITRLNSIFPDLTIGLSDHFNGILTGPLAFMLGAKVFEKHVTFDRSLKGTDHPFSLEPDGFRKFVRDIKRTPVLLECSENKDLGSEPVFKKLGKSICASCDIPNNTLITSSMLTGKITRPGVIPVRESNCVIGSFSCRDIPKGSFLQTSDFTHD